MDEDFKPKVLSEFKYYKGKGTIYDNPYPHEDIRSRFWHGECMFSDVLRDCESEDDINEKIQHWAKSVPKWRTWLKKHKPNQSARFLRENTDRQLAIALYIVTLWGKWMPYVEKPTHVDPVRQFSFDPRKFLFFDPFKCPG